MMRRLQRRGARWMLMGVVTLGWASFTSAQASYTVFPANPSTSNVVPVQPTKHSVTLVATNSTILSVAKALADQAHLQLTYAVDMVTTKRISVHIVDLDVVDAFQVALRGTGLEAKFAADGETVVIRAKSGVTGAPVRVASGVIVGRVTDSASGRGLVGASVKVAGTKLSTVTSDSGHFTLRNVPVGDQILSVKLFGYRQAERTVTVVDSVQTTVKVVLVSVPTVLSGVVTTAVGQQQRYEVGNDITVLNADSIQQIAPVSTLTQMLETRVPGLVVQNTSGIPGAPSRLRLRGINSINSSSDPIVIVNGIRVYADQSGTTSASQGGVGIGSVSTGGGSTIGGGSQSSVSNPAGTGFTYAGPSALDQIDPNSIETIEVLKGPSATAIYGSDAGSGVIVITTKKGHVGPTHWTLALDQGRTTLPGEWPVNWYAIEHDRYSPNQNVIPSSNSGSLNKENTEIVPFQALNDPRYSPLTGQAGHNSDVSLTVSGGSGSLTYSVTGTASTQSGYLHLPAIEQERFQLFHGFPVPSWMITPDQYTTWGGSSLVTAVIGDRGASVSLTSSLFRSAQQQSSLQNDVASLSQLYVDTSQLAAQPLFPDYYTRVQLGTVTFNNAVTLGNWAPWRWLPLNATLGLNVGNQDNTSLLPRDYITCLGNTYDPQCGQDSLGSYFLNQGTNTVMSLTAGTTLTARRLMSTALGFNVYTTAQSSSSQNQIGLPIGVMVPSFFNNGSGGHGAYTTTNVATYGWYVQPTLNLASRFFASPGFRLDGGSASGTHGGLSGGGLSAFPKIDLSYLAVDRSPSNPLFGVLTQVRPRIAFGIAGVQPGPDQQLRLSTLTQDNPITLTGPGTPNDVLNLVSLGNPNLHPERDRELEGGIDLTFWDQRFTLNFTGYNKTAKDAILNIQVAPSIYGGYLQQAKNIGTLRNTGLEVESSARILDSRAVAWTVNAHVTKNKNVVVSLVPGQLPIVTLGSGYQTRLTPGYPINGIWAAPVASFVDANHDSYIEESEIVVGDSVAYVGAPIPNYELAISTTLTFFNGRVSLNTSLDYQDGLTQVNGGASVSGQFFSPTETFAQEAALQAIGGNSSLAGTSSTGGGSAIGLIQTVNLLRWNTVSLNVLVPSSLSRLARVPTMFVALQGSNLGIHTNYRGADPNVNAFSSGNLTVDAGQLPQPRVWSLRVSLGN